ncbi:MAG: hypothetical protein KGH65_04175 [Candidatus Micrarchaeota archaeon]|nr:hypothetical protein [Candidatus Micrarchaeota archaeon]
MKIFKNSNKTVLVATGDGGKCPRAIVSKNKAKFADDYYGRLNIKKSVLSKIFVL